MVQTHNYISLSGKKNNRGNLVIIRTDYNTEKIKGILAFIHYNPDKHYSTGVVR